MKYDLVGGIPTPLKNIKVSWDDYSQYMEKLKMFPTTNQNMILLAVQKSRTQNIPRPCRR